MDWSIMARPKKPARLWYDETAGTWCILDSGHKERLGVCKEEREQAERRLESYLTAKRRTEKSKPQKNRRADEISCAEVLGRYLEKAVVARPEELGQRVDALLDYWGEMTLDAIDEDSCEDFVDVVGSASYGRRCLEDFRAATNGYVRAGILREVVRFTLPTKPSGRVDWLTWPEAVALCKTASRFQEVQVKETRDGPKSIVTRRRPTKHIVQFVATAIATCSRSARIYEASYEAEKDRPWVDLVGGLYYRAAPDEAIAANKQAPTIPIGARLLRSMKRWHYRGDRYVVQYAGRPADCKKAFVSTVKRARESYPHLFKRPDGSPKKVVRHILRHTGITWLAIAGVDPYEICKFAGLKMETFENVYSHHHPDYMSGVRKAQAKKPKLKVAAE